MIVSKELLNTWRANGKSIGWIKEFCSSKGLELPKHSNKLNLHSSNHTSKTHHVTFRCSHDNFELLKQQTNRTSLINEVLTNYRNYLENKTK